MIALQLGCIVLAAGQGTILNTVQFTKSNSRLTVVVVQEQCNQCSSYCAAATAVAVVLVRRQL